MIQSKKQQQTPQLPVQVILPPFCSGVSCVQLASEQKDGRMSRAMTIPAGIIRSLFFVL